MNEAESLLQILLIDDDQVDRAMVRRALNRSGLEIQLSEAQDGKTGLALADQRGFDCILLDYRLPDLDASDVLKGLLSSRCGNQTVLMLTGEADQDVALRLMSAGALDYLSKAEASPTNLARAIRYAQARRIFVSEREAARREAEDKSRALDALNKQKDLLFSIIAHDLRNPFQALLGSSQLLARAVARKDEDAVARLVHGIGQASAQAHALMESLFAWANLQMDTVEVVKGAVDVSEVSREVLAGAAEAAAAKQLSLMADCSGVHVLAHRNMLIAVLRNLVGNAIKFTPRGGTIEIRAADCGEFAEIVVADTGVGIPEDRISEIFRLDQRVTTEGTAGEKGSGLGLLLCRDLSERQGGKLTAESVVGRGTTFCIALPVARGDI